MTFFEGKGMTGGYGGPDIITSCTINVDQGEIVAILGNSMGWYSALAMSGSISYNDGNDLIYNMGTLMDEKTIGGQIIYPIVDVSKSDDPFLHIAAVLSKLTDFPGKNNATTTAPQKTAPQT